MAGQTLAERRCGTVLQLPDIQRANHTWKTMSIAIEQHITAGAPPALPDHLHSPAGSPHAFSYLQEESTYPRSQVLSKEPDFCSTSRKPSSRSEYARAEYSPSGSSLPALAIQGLGKPISVVSSYALDLTVYIDPTTAEIVLPNTTSFLTNMDAANNQQSGTGQPPAKRRRATKASTKTSPKSKAQAQKEAKVAKTAKTSKAVAQQNSKTSMTRRSRTTLESSGSSRKKDAIMDERDGVANQNMIGQNSLENTPAKYNTAYNHTYNQDLNKSLNDQFQKGIGNDIIGDNGKL